MASFDRLRWQCRRGLKELDLLLQAYLEMQYFQADDEEKKQFAKLLQWDDDELLEVLMGELAEEETEEMKRLLEKIRAFAEVSGG